MYNVMFSSLFTPRNILRANGQCAKCYKRKEHLLICLDTQWHEIGLANITSKLLYRKLNKQTRGSRVYRNPHACKEALQNKQKPTKGEQYARTGSIHSKHIII